MKLHVDVTQEDIDQGEPIDGYACMVSLAVQRATEGAFCHYGVYTYRTRLVLGPNRTRIRLPRRVVNAIFRFDQRSRGVAPPDPFNFDIDIPESALATEKAGAPK